MLAAVHDLLVGSDGFYDDIFASLGVPVRARALVAGPPAGPGFGRRPREGHRGAAAREHVPRARPPHREPRPARPEEAAHAPRARPDPLGPHDLGPRPRVPHRRARGRVDDEAPRHPRRAPRRVRAHDRRRVHAHPGARSEDLDPGARRGRARRGRRRRQDRDPRLAQRGRGVRALPAHEVPRPEALQPRRRGDADPDARVPARRGGRRRHAGSRDGHVAPRPAQRARQHRRQVVRADLPRVRGRARPERAAGLGRREVPRRRDRHVQEPVGRTRSTSRSPPTRATSRPSTRWSRAWRGPSRTAATTSTTSRCSRC